MLSSLLQGAPYLIKLDNWTEDSGNEGLEGYSMDLIDEISKILNFKYEFYLVKDGKYGSLNPITRQWDGIIKDLLDRVSFVILSCFVKLDQVY